MVKITQFLWHREQWISQNVQNALGFLSFRANPKGESRNVNDPRCYLPRAREDVSSRARGVINWLYRPHSSARRYSPRSE